MVEQPSPQGGPRSNTALMKNNRGNSQDKREVNRWKEDHNELQRRMVLGCFVLVRTVLNGDAKGVL